MNTETINTKRMTYSKSDVVTMTGLSLSTVNRLLESGKLHSGKVGRRVIIPRDAVENMFGYHAVERLSPR